MFGPLLYNSLPKYLRDIESTKTETLKLELELIPELISDEPKILGYVRTAKSNSILDQLSHRRAQGI